MGRAQLENWKDGDAATQGEQKPIYEFFFVDHGQAGDSGTLVMDSARQTAVAIYAGEIAALNGIDEGWGQHLGQVTDAMDFTLMTG